MNEIENERVRDARVTPTHAKNARRSALRVKTACTYCAAHDHTTSRCPLYLWEQRQGRKG